MNSIDSIFEELEQLSNNSDNQKIRKKLILASRIIEAMEDKGLNKTKFADLMDKRPSEITKWLSGTHNFTYETLCDIAEKLETTISRLAHDDRDHHTGQTEQTSSYYMKVSKPIQRRKKPISEMYNYASIHKSSSQTPLKSNFFNCEQGQA
jgi:transcriptional regulator with XRE-family HTH domain